LIDALPRFALLERLIDALPRFDLPLVGRSDDAFRGVGVGALFTPPGDPD